MKIIIIKPNIRFINLGKIIIIIIIYLAICECELGKNEEG